MNKGESKWVPQHPYWHEDLPERDAPRDRAPKMVHGDINAMDNVFLEVSRASSIMRGLGALFGILGAIALVVFLLLCVFLILDADDDITVVVIGWLIAAVGLGWGVALLLRIDFTIPRDRPVRFNRGKRKIYVYEHAYTWNPFVKWPTTIKVFDWNTTQSELHRQAGFNGKIYMQRFSLWLVSHKQGTNEVLERFELKGNMPTTEELYNAWAYCRHYMEQGVDGLPIYPPRRQVVSFRRSLFEYIRFLDPTEEGREVRSRMTVGDWAFNLPLTLLMFWLFIPMGIGHYIAMRFAPDVKWPPDIDAESRSS